MMKKILVLVFVSALFLSSCSPKIPFTQTARDTYSLKAEDLKRIQFYTSEDITLVRGEKRNNVADTYSHNLVVRSGKRVEEIVIKKNTPGMVEFVEDDYVKVSFENGPDRSIIFSVTSDKDDVYRFTAEAWEDGKGRIKYENKVYFAVDGSAEVQLLFKMKSLNEYKTKRRVASGKSFGLY